jgi:hypothetical protein
VQLLKFAYFCALALPAVAAAQKPPIIPRVDCKLDNEPWTVVRHREDKTAYEEEVDDWRVSCTITVGDKKVYDAPLDLAHPTAFRDAMEAVEEFRTKKAAQIIKQKK